MNLQSSQHLSTKTREHWYLQQKTRGKYWREAAAWKQVAFSGSFYTSQTWDNIFQGESELSFPTSEDFIFRESFLSASL